MESPRREVVDDGRRLDVLGTGTFVAGAALFLGSMALSAEARFEPKDLQNPPVLSLDTQNGQTVLRLDSAQGCPVDTKPIPGVDPHHVETVRAHVHRTLAGLFRTEGNITYRVDKKLDITPPSGSRQSASTITDYRNCSSAPDTCFETIDATVSVYRDRGSSCWTFARDLGDPVIPGLGLVFMTYGVAFHFIGRREDDDKYDIDLDDYLDF